MMRLMGRNKIRAFQKEHAETKNRLTSWENYVTHHKWTKYKDVKDSYPKASHIKDGIWVFDIGQYRIITKIHYESGIVLVEKILSHDEYDRLTLR